MGLPLWALPQNPATSNDYFTNFINANWLVNDHSFAFYFPVTNNFQNDEKYLNNFVGFGNPSIHPKFKLPNLPSAEEEIILLALYSGETNKNIFTKENATKSNFLKALSEPTKKLAIGTHSLSYDPQNSIFQPILLFAGTDSIITSEDILSSQIKSQLVMLTSCNTVDDTSSYDFTLLPRSFLVAGSKAVLFSNWEIESSSTSKISQGIFKNFWINEDISVQESLRLSVKEALTKSDSLHDLHPKFWAGMSVAYGNI